MKSIIAVCLFLSALLSVHPNEEEDNLYGFLAGEYHLIGRAPDSQKTYTGTIRFIWDEKKKELRFIRTTGKTSVSGIAKIEAALAGEARVLRLRFREDNRDMEGTFLWRSDLDNYARISGYIYQKQGGTKSPGLEAYFIRQN